jgi:lysine-N-methylase
MSIPLRHLPVLQNWDCHSCTHCCREYNVSVTAEERQRIEAQGWQSDPDIGGQALFVRSSWLSGKYHLAHQKEGGCVFLGADQRCKIHAKFGAAAKPLACRLFPFTLTPAGDHWRAGIRYACPSAAEDRGQPISEHIAELNRLAQELEKQENIKSGDIPPPPLQRGQPRDWPDVLRFVKTLHTLVSNRKDPLEHRLRICLALARVCREAKFDKVQGQRLDEFLQVLSPVLDEEVPEKAADVPHPTWVGRSLFRQQAALYGRKDRGPYRGQVSRNPLSRFWSGWRFGIGAGKVPKVNGLIADVEFDELEVPKGPLSAEAEQSLERYFLVKLNSCQFFGPGHFHLPLWDGLETLCLMHPLILWLSRALRADSREQAIQRAMSIVDDHFGYNPILKRGRYRRAVRILASQGELAKLIAWYSR